jgi:hypothetical protein
MRNIYLIILLLQSIVAIAQTNPADSIIRKKYFTRSLNGAINIDGIPSEEAWNAVEWGGDFIQWQPSEGKPPSQPTSFKIVYDEKFLYIAYRCHDTAPDSIVRRMDRRDQFPGDWVEINIDSYHDLRTAFSFTLSASVVRSDELASNDGMNWDANWISAWTDGQQRSRSPLASCGMAMKLKKSGVCRSAGDCSGKKNAPIGSTYHKTPACG